MQGSSSRALPGLTDSSVRYGHLLMAKEALEKRHRAPYDRVRQLPAERFARLVGIAERPIRRDLLKRERHAHPW